MKVFYAQMLRYWLKAGLLPILAGVLYVLAFPPYELRFLVPVALLGFLYSLRGLGPVEARRCGFLFGMTVMTLGCWWLHLIFGLSLVVLAAAHALFFAVFGWAHALIDRQRWGAMTKALAVACAWTGVEYIRAEHFCLDFPWMTPGHGLGVIPFLTQPWLSAIGVYGMGFVVVFAGAAVVRRGDALKFGGYITPLEVLVLMDLAAAAWGTWRPPSPPADDASLPAIAFAAVQSESGSLGHFYEATDALPAKTDLVIWPEESLPYDIAKAKKDWVLLDELVKKKRCVLVLGTQQSDTQKGWYNTALTLDDTAVLGRHYKNHPVHLFDDGTPGTVAVPVNTRLGKIGTPICFDCDYEDIVRKMTRAGAECFAVPSMDPIAWGPVQRLQHARLFQIRAAENGRAMVVCATSGVTQTIDAWGQGSRIEPFTPGVLTGRLVPRRDLTFYTRYGWMFPWLALAGGLGFLVAAWRGGRVIKS